MNLDTNLEEEQRKALERQRSNASDAEMAQMGGAEPAAAQDDGPTWQPDWRNGVDEQPMADFPAPSNASDAEMAQMGGAEPAAAQDDGPTWQPDWRNGVDEQPMADFPAPSGDETAPPPAPVAETPPESQPATAVDLLAQVKRGQISRPAVDAAFGPPPTPRNEPGASAFPPKMGEAQGVDWKGLADRLASARQRDDSTGRNNALLSSSVLGAPLKLADGHETAGAEDEMKIAQAKAAEGDKFAARAAQAAEAKRRAEHDDWTRFDAGLKGVTAAQKDADRAKADAEKAKLESEHQAVGDQRLEQTLAETIRHNQAMEGNAGKAIDARAKKTAGGGLKAKAAAEKAAKAATNVDTMIDGIYEGTIDPADLGTRSNEFKQDFETAMARKHPGFSMSKAGQLFRQLNEYADAKAGSAGATLQATKTAYSHLKLMRDQFAKLDNGDSRTINELRQRFANQLGFSDVSAALGAVKAGNVTTGSELATTYNHATEGGHKAYEAILDPATPPKVAAAQFEMILKQMDERMAEREAPLRRMAQTPGHHKLVDELGMARQPEGGDEKKPVKYLVSPDKTRRVPVYADGTKGPEEQVSR